MSMGANTWYNVGFYMGTDSIKIYINGQLQGSMVSTSLFNYANTNVYLGGTNSSIYNLPFNGKMDNVRFYNRKLYNYEFNTLTNTTLDCGSAGTALLNGLQACYPFNCSPYNFAPTTTPNAPSLDANPVGVSCTTGHSGNANGAYKMWGVPTSYIELPNDSRIKPNAVSVSC